MLELDYPWALALLPLPLLVFWLLPAYRETSEAVRIPFFDRAAAASGQTPSAGALVLRRSWLQWIVAPLCWGLILLAASRPQWVEEPIVRVQAARDLMLLVDLSGSMDTRDFTSPSGESIDRLEAVKLVLDDFIERREGDRVGLIVFGNAAYVQAPFTLDHAAVRQMLDQTRPRMAGPQTMIGEALGLAIQLFEESEVEQRVAILLTDGNDTGSRMPPVQAAEIAADNGITVHTVAVGDPETAGEAELDLETLEEIAAATGGEFFRAEDREQLEEIYATLDRLEPAQIETVSYRPKRPLFHWPLGLALVVLLLFEWTMVISTRSRGAAPARASEGATDG